MPMGCQASTPALNATTGMPLASAACTAARIASGLANVTAMPLTPLSTAVWTRLAWLGASGSLEYRNSMLSFLAAVSAPLRIRSQNESPGTSWVIIAIVTRGVSAVLPPMPPPDSWGLPPVPEHDASKLITAAAAAMGATPRGRRRVDESGRQSVYLIAFLVFLWRREGVADGSISHVDGDCLRVRSPWGHAGRDVGGVDIAHVRDGV